uniref:Alkylated DNA repair protein alkB homolog 8 n=1 Tax=Schistocephalus solidus TaxID=70667 RepID=A0A0V0J1V3_SCHSO
MDFLKTQPEDAWGADVGCGNGKYLLALHKARSPLLPLLASDASVNLARTVRRRGFDVVVANLLALPYRSGILDFFICIAVLHHLSTPERRIDGIRKLADLLRVGGQGLIQVWAKKQNWKGKTAVYIQKNTSQSNTDSSSGSDAGPTRKPVFEGLTLPIQKPRTPFVASDVLLPWKAKENKGQREQSTEAEANRYYHVFEEGELEALINQVPCLCIQSSVYEQGNWSIIVRKTVS